MRYAREMLGMRGGFLRPNPYHGNKMINDPMYEPFWTMVETLDFLTAFMKGRPTRCPRSASTALKRIARRAT